MKKQTYSTGELQKSFYFDDYIGEKVTKLITDLQAFVDQIKEPEAFLELQATVDEDTGEAYSYRIVSVREETDEQFQKRIEREKLKKEILAAETEKKERAEYERLKKKFDGPQETR